MRIEGLFVLAACGGNGGGDNPDAAIPDTAVAIDAACTTTWTQHASDPQFPFRAFGGAVWNDPWVVADGSGYRMWISNGAGPSGVSIYEARSDDGDTWALQSAVGSPQLAPGPSAFDQVSVETPAVARLGATFHLFYTAVPDNGFVSYSVGHATSPDGVTWTKDAQPAIPRPTTPNEWGWLGVAEPGVIVKDNTLYVYYAMVRCREGFANGACTGPDPKAIRGIGLATSIDGVTFVPEPNNPVVIQSARYPATASYEGYSTPAAVLRGNTVHLFYDVVRDEGGFRQVSLTHATSVDGRSFTETEPDFVERDPTGWTSYEVRAPTAVDRGDHFELWFAGNNGNDPTAAGFTIGIGHATTSTTCP